MNMSLLGKALTELDKPPVKAMVVYNSNPAAVAPDLSSAIASWKARRLAHVAAGRSRLFVGHEDLAAWLPISP